MENEYKDDHVQIRIRQKEINAPQYLIDKVQQKLNELLLYSTVCRFCKLSTTITLTDDERTQLYCLARKNYCRIDKINVETDWIVCSIPKAFPPSAVTSSLVVQRSKEFSSSLSMKKISLLESSIEIYLTEQTTFVPVR